VFQHDRFLVPRLLYSTQRVHLPNSLNAPVFSRAVQALAADDTTGGVYLAHMLN
jgi:hypothetical protein